MATVTRTSEEEEDRKELTRLRGELERVQIEIEAVKQEIETVKRQLEVAEAQKEDRDTIKYFRDEKNKLRDKENKLRDKENKLRDKENILLGLQQRHEVSMLIEAWKATEKVLVEGQKALVEGQRETIEGQKALVEGQKETIELIKEGQTETRSMSSANLSFTETLLGGLGITWEPAAADTTNGINYDFDWSGAKGEVTLRAMEHLNSILGDFDVGGKPFGLFDARQLSLSLLCRNGKRANGRSDLGVALQAIIDAPQIDNLTEAVALIELKTSEAPINRSQILLELVSLARTSAFGTGAVVLGTDCINRWVVAYFVEYKRVVVQNFLYGSRCLSRLNELIKTAEQRKESNRPPERIDCIPENEAEAEAVHSGVAMRRYLVPEASPWKEQDLSGFPTTPRDEALECEAYLLRLAAALKEWTGGAEDPVVPEWARADVRHSSSYFT